MISWERYEEIKTRVSEVFEDYEPKGLPIDIFCHCLIHFYIIMIKMAY